MIEILDHPNDNPPYWEVFHVGNSKMPTKVIYYPNGLGNVDRDIALKQIIDTDGTNGHRILS